MNTAVKNFLRLQVYIKDIGYKPSLGSYEKRKLGIFNVMNVLGLATGLIVIPIAAAFTKDHFPPFVWLIAGSPALISAVVLTANHFQRYELGRMCYFILYPVMTSLVYAVKLDMGLEFFFVMYGVLSVFFLRNTYNIIFSF